MNNRGATLRCALLAACAGVLCSALPAAHAQAGATRPASTGEPPSVQFAVASVRPSSPGGQLSFDVTNEGFRAQSTPLFWIILEAYCPMPVAYWRSDRVVGAPEWVRTAPLDIDARLSEAEMATFARLSQEQREAWIKPRLQQLLRERFGLEVHLGTGSAFVWELSSSRKVRMTPAVPGVELSGAISIGDGAQMMNLHMSEGRHGLRFHNVSMPTFAEVLSGLATEEDPPIVDRTQLPGRFDFVLYKREQDPGPREPSVPPPATGWDVEALGLRLVRGRADLPTVAIDQVHPPNEN